MHNQQVRTNDDHGQHGKYSKYFKHNPLRWMTRLS